MYIYIYLFIYSYTCFLYIYRGISHKYKSTHELWPPQTAPDHFELTNKSKKGKEHVH